jgi:hypothetical protein
MQSTGGVRSPCILGVRCASKRTVTPRWRLRRRAVQLPLEAAQCLHSRQALREAGIRFAVLADGGEKFAILQLDTVRRDIDLRHIDGIVLAVQQFIVACDVSPVIADVAEERAQGGRSRRRLRMRSGSCFGGGLLLLSRFNFNPARA